MNGFKLILLIIWAILTISFSLVYYFKIKKPNRLNFEFSDFITLSGLVLGVMSGINLIYLVFFSGQIKEVFELDFEDIITLALGPLATIWLSIQEIWKLFAKLQPQGGQPQGQNPP
ncbi:MAG: hypothetical protein HC865_08485 [Cyanobacteria bacterium RU_5_0]|nr:hypothetical protein [Cyanobacteria bacterium RU_5_0]